MAPADGLKVKLFAAEPDIRQPIFVKCDDRGRVWTIQYLQYPNPAGLKRVQVDRYSRTVYDRVPDPPPRGPRGVDRITICEDADGDGRADRFKDFVAGLNLCTGVEFGHGGVFVLQVPYLLFYPDRDRDDVPDSDPEVLLAGFGMEDAQSLANHLTWGPDGWLYGLNGSTTTCDVRGIEFQQGVWRYHPLTKEFELFCEGGGNVFGLTFDNRGNLFYSSNLGLFWHAHQGAYYFKNFGKHGALHNPYAYGWLSHVEYDAPTTGGPTTGGTVYGGDSFPERFRGRFLAGDFLRHTASSWEVVPAGATVTARFRELLLDSRDTWFGATDLCLGPDGSVYLSDFYDRRTAHPDPDADWDRTNGRIYKITAAGAKSPRPIDLAALSSSELVELQKHPNGWHADRARVLLAARRDQSVWPALRDMARRDDDRLALRGLWALYVSGGFDVPTAAELLTHRSEYVRAWTIRLLGDEKSVPPELASRFAELAASDPSPVVRAQLACTAKRLQGDLALPTIERLLLRDSDADDPVIPWLLWWAIESKAITDRERIVTFFASAEKRESGLVRANVGRLVRRYAAEAAGDAAALRLLAADKRPELLADLDRGLAERASHQTDVRTELAELIRASWEAEPTDAVRTRLALRAGVSAARERVHRDVTDPHTPKPLLLERLAALEELGIPACVPAVPPLLASPDQDVQQAVLAVLARFTGPDVTAAVLKAYPSMPPAVQARARRTLFSRADAAKAFLALVEAGQIAPVSVPVEDLSSLALLGDTEIDAAVRKHWGRVGPGTPEEKLAEVRRFSNDLRAGEGDPLRGKAVFQKQCAACHTLFAEGGKVGPDLTNTSRADAPWLLTSIVDPGQVVRSQYLPHVVQTREGLVLSGVLVAQDAASVTLADSRGETTRLTRDRIEELSESTGSVMPERLLDPLTPQERRDLFRYLQESAPPLAH